MIRVHKITEFASGSPEATPWRNGSSPCGGSSGLTSLLEERFTLCASADPGLKAAVETATPAAAEFCSMRRREIWWVEME